MKKRLTTILLLIALAVSLVPAGGIAAAAAGTYTDVASDAAYAEHIAYVSENNLMNGVGDGKFDPNGTLNRAMLVTVLYRIEGEPAVSGDSFSDVPAGQWYSDAVIWAASNGIVEGYGENMFGPSDPLTRQQMAAILYRYASYKNYDTSAAVVLSAYADSASVASWASESVSWAIAAELLSDDGNSNIRPTDNATRAESATAISVFCQTVADTASGSTDADDILADNRTYAKKAYRIFPYYWLDDAAFSATLAGLVKYQDVVDEVTLFCDYMHQPYMTEAMLSEYTGILTKRIATLRSRGFESVGINMLQTLGHGDYPVYQVPDMPWPSAVDYNGGTSRSQPCPRNASFLSYIEHKYTVYAETGPDFIWVDDDFRVPDKNVSYICFCDSCIRQFNSKYHYSYTRANLVGALSAASGIDLRRKWSEFNLDQYEYIMSLIKKTVNKVDPDIELGIMTVQVAANEYLLGDWAGMAKALGATKHRPGGGFYNEYNLLEFLAKACGISEQVAQLDFIEDVQYEVEDWPDNYDKSARTHIAETTAGIMAGANGVAFASVPPDKGNDEIMEAIRSAESMWDDMVRIGSEWKLYGSTVGYYDDYGIYADPGRYFTVAGHGFYNQALTPFTYGLMSYTPYQENSCITVITEDMVKSIPDADIKTILSKGVILDGGAARMLKERGYGPYIGASAFKWEYNNVQERYSKDSLNGEAAGTLRFIYGSGLYTFTLLSGARSLSYLETTVGLRGGTASYAFQNSLGGRVVVFGYMPWDYFGNWRRLEQGANLIEWLSKGQDPVKVLNDNRIFSLIKQPEDRSKFMLMLINATLDYTSDNLQVRLLGNYTSPMYYYDEDHIKRTLPSTSIKVSGDYTIITLPKISPWGVTVVYSE